MAKFKTVITTAGAAKIAAVLAGTGSIVLDSNARMAIGDGNGTLPTPVPSQTALVHEVYRAALNNATIDDRDPKNIVAELVIPPDKGGFWMREMALYDAAGTLLAVGNMAETYKPSLSEGAGRKLVIRMVIAVSDVSAVTITMDTSTVMATKDYVDNQIDEHEKSRNHPDATLTQKGFTQLNSDTNNASETLAATPKAVKTVMDATNLKAPLASPALTGAPTAPTAPAGTNTTQLANTAFVQAAITALINASPGLLDTLGELAAAINNDANFAATMAAALAAKAPLANPVLTGTPQAPTPAAGTNTQQLATTAFVQAAVTRLINSSPAALDTLKELADALGNDANFATTMTNALAGKQPKDTTLTNISGKDVPGLLQYLRAVEGDDCNVLGFVSGDKSNPYARHKTSDSIVRLATLDYLKDYQPRDATLTAIAGLVGSANKLLYFTGADVAALTDLTALARTLLACDDTTAMRNAISAVAGDTCRTAGFIGGNANAPYFRHTTSDTVIALATMAALNSGLALKPGTDGCELVGFFGGDKGRPYVKQKSSGENIILATAENITNRLAEKMDTSGFAGTLGPTTGNQQLGAGKLIVQYGEFSIGAAAGANTTITFNRAFPNACVAVIPVPGSGGAAEQFGASGKNTTQATITKGIGDVNARSGVYIALGY